MPDLIQKHIRTYLRYRGWKAQGPLVQVREDENLHAHYPVAAYSIGGYLYVMLAPFLMPGKEMLEGLPPSASAMKIISILMEGVQMQPDASGFYTVDPDHLQPASPPAGAVIRPLTAADAGIWEEMLSACNPLDREAGALSLEDPLILGCFDETGTLASAASFWYWGKNLADIGVLTHPDRRGRGFGRAVVSALCREGFATGRNIQYRCDDKNEGSVALCKSLGFVKSFSMEGVILRYPEDDMDDEADYLG